MIFETIALGFVCWLVTTVIVESEMVRPIREWINNKYTEAYDYPEYPATVREDGWKAVFWYKLKYLVGCHLCTGIWVGLILAALTPWVTPIAAGAMGVVLNGLLYKAIGHTVLVWQKYMEAKSV